jgi:hypothetical protein
MICERSSGGDEIVGCDWREVDRTLCGLARQRAALDVEEARWLRAAERLKIWHEVGCISLLEYMERRLGYGPRAAHERLRVAFALEQLPGLEQALATGELPFTGVRELSRTMTPETEDAWLEAARNKSVHEIEQMVAGHAKGDLPTDPARPEIITRVVRFDVRPATYARLREARAVLEKEHGQRLDDDAFIAALCSAVLDREPAGDDTDRGRAAFQVATTICEQCERGWQEGGGVTVEVDAAEVERASCDAQWVGSLDSDEPERATQNVPPRVRRFVWRRDRGTCAVPGCRSKRFLQIHHITAREDGGTHEPGNLMLIYDGHHAELHRGRIAITGKAPDQLVVNHPRAHVGAPSEFAKTSMRVDAKTALVTLGYKKHEAAAAVEAAYAHVGGDVSLERLIREALRRCM